MRRYSDVSNRTTPDPTANPTHATAVIGTDKIHFDFAINRHHAPLPGQQETEVDIVLEAPDGRVVAIEVKAAATLQRKDLAGLSLLRNHLGDRFVGGYVACTAPQARIVGDRFTMLPIETLWQG
ncbi:MAG: hypothetical protein R2722_13440 [Tessaracoccus sp.]